MRYSNTLREAAAAAAIPAVVALLLTACVSPGASPTPADGGGATTVDVTLQEWAVIPAAGSVPAGQMTFNVTNEGPEDIHEFVVIATDLDPAQLPTDEHGAVIEGGEEMEVVDEIEDLPVGHTQSLNVTLEAGKYVLLCNIYSESEKEAHYKLGMRTAFEVTGP